MQRVVVVNGVQVPMHYHEEGDRFSPLKIAIGLLRAHPSESFGGAPEEDALAAIDALEDAGVKWLPLYETEAKKAGIEWVELAPQTEEEDV